MEKRRESSIVVGVGVSNKSFLHSARRSLERRSNPGLEVISFLFSFLFLSSSYSSKENRNKRIEKEVKESFYGGPGVPLTPFFLQFSVAFFLISSTIYHYYTTILLYYNMAESELAPKFAPFFSFVSISSSVFLLFYG